MATIRTILNSGQRRIITKTSGGIRRISCSCCPTPGCCPYPAQALIDGVYTWEDLPDELYAPFENITYTKVQPYQYFGLTIYYDGPVVAGETQYIYIEVVEGLGNTWNSGSLSTAGGPCLLQDQEAPLIEDTFSDTYGYEIEFEGDIIESGTLVRDSLCLWLTNNPFLKGIIYDSEGGSGGDDPLPCRFSGFDGDDFKAINKTSPATHNTPVGQYSAVAGSLYDGAITTVFEL